MKRTVVAVTLLALTLAAGCARPPRPGEPIDRAGIEDLLTGATACLGNGPLRGTGSGELVTAGGARAFSFALVYDPPAWLRADVRPALSAPPAASGVSALLAGDRLTARLPAGDAWLALDLRDLLPGIEWTDPGGFLVGRPDLRFLAHLSRPRLTRGGDELVVSGELLGRSVSTAFDSVGLCVRRIELSDGGGREVSVSYVGRQADGHAGVPGEVHVRYTDGRGTAALRLAFDRVTGTGPVDRAALDLAPPDGAPTLGWSDITGEGEEP